MIGAGAREHALCWRLAHEGEVFCAPGNPGIGDDVPCTSIAVSSEEELIRYAKQLSPVTVVIGPEDPLINGLGTAFRQQGIPVFGPGSAAAQLEGSKAFSKGLMAKCGVPTAAFETFEDFETALAYAKKRCDADGGVVVKASGNALGKGAIVCDSAIEAEDALRRMILSREFGTAGETVVVEQRLQGFEFSLLTLVSDEEIQSLPIAQDYKRAYDGGKGPNTGGMGSFSPSSLVSSDLAARAEEEIVRPILAEMARQNVSYRGVLFSGILVQDGRPYCLEYNVRFGDPETQSIMMRLESGFAHAISACADGRPIPPIELSPRASATVVIAAKGYPESPEKGQEISVPGEMPDAKLFYAGVRAEGRQLVTSGGRVFSASALGDTLELARAKAYELAGQVQFDGAWSRSDIASEA